MINIYEEEKKEEGKEKVINMTSVTVAWPIPDCAPQTELTKGLLFLRWTSCVALSNAGLLGEVKLFSQLGVVCALPSQGRFP